MNSNKDLGSFNSDKLAADEYFNDAALRDQILSIARRTRDDSTSHPDERKRRLQRQALSGYRTPRLFDSSGPDSPHPHLP